MNFPVFLDIMGLALIGWIAHNIFSKNGNLIAFHTSKENKKSFETFLPADRLNFHCFQIYGKSGVVYSFFFSNLRKKDKTYVVVAASGIGGFFNQ